MTNGIIDGVCMAINAEFNAEADEYEIYTELVEQGMTKPCFSILLINSTITPSLKPRYFKTHQICVHYFPESSDIQAESNAVKDRLEQCLEYIMAGEDLIRGKDMSANLVEDVLHFFVNYDFYVTETGEEDAMETLETDVQAKENE